MLRNSTQWLLGKSLWFAAAMLAAVASMPAFGAPQQDVPQAIQEANEGAAANFETTWTADDLAFKQALDMDYGMKGHMAEEVSQDTALQAWKSYLERKDVPWNRRLFAHWRMGCLSAYNLRPERGEEPNFDEARKHFGSVLAVASELDYVSNEVINSTMIYYSLGGSDMERASALGTCFKALSDIDDTMIWRSAENASKLGYLVDVKFFTEDLSIPPLEERYNKMQTTVQSNVETVERNIEGFLSCCDNASAKNNLLQSVKVVAQEEVYANWEAIAGTAK